MIAQTRETDEAQALWQELRDALTDSEAAIKQIIAAKAWKPLGYETFSEAWDDRMRGVALANSIKPYVIYAMLDERLTPEDIVQTTGWGADQVLRASQDHAFGVPVEGATVVRQHVRQKPGERKTIHVTFEWDEMSWLNDLIKRSGRELHREAKLGIIAHFEALEARLFGEAES